MLMALKIKDFAIIDDVEIEFKEGMTVLTGETGSGKSIIIDAIGLILGERAQSEMVRFDKEKAIIEGLFAYQHPKIDQLLQEYGIEADGTLAISREINKNGRNICRLNGSLVSVNQLKQIGELLVDVHVQHDTTRLISTNNYLDLIDRFADAEFQMNLSNYQTIYHNYQNLLKKYQQLKREHLANQEKLDFYKFQLEEFRSAKISLNEYNDLIHKRNVIANYEKIYENLNKAYTNLKESSVLDKIYQAGNSLQKLADLNETYKQLSEQLLNAYYQLDDLSNSVGQELEGLDYNPNELEMIESRLAVYSALKRKYKLEVEELINYQNELKEKVNSIDHYDDYVNELEADLKALYATLYQSAYNLRTYRENLGNTLKTKLIEHLKDLKLANTTFTIVFNSLSSEANFYDASMFNEFGFDEIDFHLSFNVGEPPKPLSKVASGGELSRFMLGLKTILAEKQNLSTMVFDEIDTGVSGITASSIAAKIKSIAKYTQVLCITHLPQVASAADHHLYIEKIETEGRTNTIVSELDQATRINEIAKMMAGDQVDEVARENAKNLLRVNQLNIK